MKKQIFRLISFTVVVALVAVCLSGCSKKATYPKINISRYNEDRFSSDFSGNGVVYENEYLEILWNNSKKLVSFREKQTGNIWGQTPQAALDSGAALTNALKSAIYVYYKDASNLGEKYAFSSEGAVQDGNVWVNKLDNGISVTYDFIDYQFSVTVDYIVEGNTFSAVVDPRKMSDDGVNYITAVSVLPFVCGVQNDNETDWLFMPDGSGSIIKPATISQMGVEGSEKVYGEDLSVQQFNFTAVKQQINMPIFGVSRENSGLLAVISSGAEQSVMAWNMGSSAVGYSTVYPRYLLRGYSLEKTPQDFGWTSLNYIKMFDESVTEIPFKVDYTVLTGENNSLSGMAKTYRDYITKAHGLSKSKTEETVANYKFVGAMQESTFFLGIPTTKLTPLTTTEQVEKITNDITGKIGSGYSVNLVGFGKSGIDVGEIGGGYTVASKLGGKRGLKKLSEHFKQNGIKSYFDFDIISYQESGAGFSYDDDAATLTIGSAAIFNQFNSISHGILSNNYHILSRKLLPDAAIKLINKKDMLGTMGASLSTLSNVIYSDYSYNDFRNCKNMSKDVKAIFKAIRKQKIGLSASAANDYAACNADVLTDCPITSSNYDFATYSVPFYQMVFKGYKPMSSVAINLTNEESTAILNCIETGTTPSYTIVSNYENTMRTSNHTFIYGSTYNNRKGYFTDSVNSTKDYFESIKGAQISGYEIINSDVRVTKYSNGVYAVVNYGKTDYESPYGVVKANSYITGSVK